VVGLGVELCVGAKGDVGVGVAELPRDVDDVEAGADQQRRVPVPERVQGEPPPGSRDAGMWSVVREVLADVAVVDAAAIVLPKT
jgi:hypothetical protein